MTNNINKKSYQSILCFKECKTKALLSHSGDRKTF